ncbi:hypothetical protein TNCV_2328101 [Trichonephila clavipes]|nr:hypothetical protein TNCV_2328101 [Trichonephila clavipes]
MQTLKPQDHKIRVIISNSRGTDRPLAEEQMELQGLQTTAVATPSTISVPTGFRPLPSSTPKSPVSLNFIIVFLKPILDMGPFRRSFK